MENEIFEIKSTFWKSLAISNNSIWLSQSRISSLEKFESYIQNPGILKSAYAYPLSSISLISFNEASESVKIKYQDEKGKLQKANIGFGDKELSNQFGRFLGDKLGLTKSLQRENQLKPLLLNLFYLIISIYGTYYLATLKDSNELVTGGTIRSRSRGAFAKTIVDTIGQKGVIIIGSLISIYLIYQLYKRFKNPTNEIIYQKQK